MYSLYPLFGMIFTVMSSEFIKLNIIKNYSPRPQNAKNCNLFCNDGDQSNKPGMPSSHMALTSYAVAYFINKYELSKYIKFALFFYVISMALARYFKYCHTIGQIIVGTLYGSFFGILSALYL